MDDEELTALEDELQETADQVRALSEKVTALARQIRAEYDRRRNGGTVHEFRPRPGGDSDE